MCGQLNNIKSQKIPGPKVSYSVRYFEKIDRGWQYCPLPIGNRVKKSITDIVLRNRLFQITVNKSKLRGRMAEWLALGILTAETGVRSPVYPMI